MDAVTMDAWTRIGERLGVPAALGFVLLVIIYVFMRRMVNAHVKLTETLGSNDGKHVEAVATSNLGHAITHEKLNQLQAQFRERYDDEQRRSRGDCDAD